jgi:hypothetical protein
MQLALQPALEKPRHRRGAMLCGKVRVTSRPGRGTRAARPAPVRRMAQGATTIPSTDPAAMHKRFKPSVPGGTPRAALTRGMWATHEATTNPFNANPPGDDLLAAWGNKPVLGHCNLPYGQIECQYRIILCTNRQDKPILSLSQPKRKFR